MRVILICAGPASLRQATAVLSRSQRFEVVHAGAGYPDRVELRRILHASGAGVLLLDFGDFDAAREVLRLLAELGSTVAVVAWNAPAGKSLDLAREGVRDVLDPESPGDVEQCLERVAVRDSAPAQGPRGQLCCFLPGKPGCGSSTLAVNAALMIARQTPQRVLLCDLDLCCATVSHYLKVPHERCIRHAIALGPRLNAGVWESLICHREGLDVVGAGLLEPSSHIDTSSLLAALDFLRSVYGLICADCSGGFEHWCLELLRSAARIFLTTTVEIPALQLTRAKAMLLRDLHLHQKTSVLLNRTEDLEPGALREIEDLMGLPVYASFANDYRGVQHAFAAAAAVDAGSELGRRVYAFASSVLRSEGECRRSARPRRKLLDLFLRRGV